MRVPHGTMRVLARHLTFAAILLTLAPAQPTHADTVILPDASDEEFVGPFPSWRNVKTHYGAVGDGVTDDTAALNAALLDLRLARNNGWSVLYLPAGTYRVTSTLVNTQRIDHNDYLGFSIIGEDPATTRIVYDGPANSDLWRLDGWYCKVSRLTLDGAGKARTLLLRDGGFSTACEISDVWFQDADVGLRLAGDNSEGQAEHAVLRCRFTRLGQGLVTGNFNSLDIWVWWGRFEDCGQGVLNAAGNYHVYNSVFLRSTDQDIASNNLMTFSFVGNTSVGSRTFFDWRGGHTWGSPVIALRNQIYQPTGGVGLHTGNGGPWVLVDNLVAGASGYNGTQFNLTGRDNLLVGNRATSASPVARSNGPRVREISTRRYDLADAPTPARLYLPPAPPRRNRAVFEVAAGTGDDAAAFQTAIDAAVASSDPHPVVHLAKREWRINRTVIVPAARALQIVGDGGAEHGTALKWGAASGVPGPVLLLRGPSRATLRDFSITANGFSAAVDGLLIEEPDLPGGRIYADQPVPSSSNINDRALHSLLVDGVEQADVTLIAGQGFSNGVNGLTVRGGPERSAGRTAPGQVSMLTGANAQSLNNYLVEQGGRALVTGFYIETQGAATTQAIKLDDTGALTLAGVRFSYTANLVNPSVLIDGFRGDLAFVANFFYGVETPDRSPSQWFSIRGDGAGLNALVAGNMFWGNYPEPDGGFLSSDFVWRDVTAPAADAAFLLNNLNGGNNAAFSSGYGFDYLDHVYRGETNAQPSDTFVADRLKLLREARIESPAPRNPVVSDVRLHRVFASTQGGRSAMIIRRTPAPGAATAPTVTLLSPGDSTRLTVDANVTLEAAPADSDGSIARVEFYADGTLLGAPVTSAPWRLTTTFTTLGPRIVSAVAYDDAGKPSASPAARVEVVATGEAPVTPFTPAAIAPRFSLPSGTYEGTRSVTLTSDTPGAFIRYTLDGTAPTRTLGTLYTGSPLAITQATVVRAVAYTATLSVSESVRVDYGIYSAATAYRLFPTLTTSSQATDGVAYELGVRFTTGIAGRVTALRYYRPASETGTHTGRLWRSNGELLATVAFTPANDAAGPGWREQPLATPISITPGETYVATVNCNTYYPLISFGLASPLSSGPLTALGGGNGVFGLPGTLPTGSYNDTNYLRDIVFEPAPAATALEQWRQLHFGSTATNTGSAANLADPDFDGINNLLEYALGGSDPTHASSIDLPTPDFDEQGHLTLTFNRVADPSLVYEVQGSSSLSGWTTLWSSTGPANVAGEVTVSDSQATSPRFLRLMVTVP